LIYLSADVRKWKSRLDVMDIDYSEFKEPDLNDKTTALAVHGHDNIFSSLHIVTED